MNARNFIALASGLLLLLVLSIWDLTGTAEDGDLAAARSDSPAREAQPSAMQAPSNEPMRLPTDVKEVTSAPDASSASGVQERLAIKLSQERLSAQVRVRGPDRKAVRRVYITLREKKAKGAGIGDQNFSFTCPSNRQGNAWFAGVPSEVELQVVVSDTAENPTHRVVFGGFYQVTGKDSVFEVELQEEDGFFLRGQVVDANGTDVEGVSVDLIEPSELATAWPPPIHCGYLTLQTDQEGGFSSFGLSREDVLLFARHDSGFQPTPQFGRPGGDPVTIQLVQGGVIEGRIAYAPSPADAPREDARGPVYLYDERGLRVRAAYANADGDFRIAGIPDGDYSVVSARMDINPGEPSWFAAVHGIQVTGTATVDSVLIEIAPEESIRSSLCYRGPAQGAGFTILHDGLRLAEWPKLSRGLPVHLMLPSGVSEVRWRADDGSFGTEVLNLEPGMECEVVFGES